MIVPHAYSSCGSQKRALERPGAEVLGRYEWPGIEPLGSLQEQQPLLLTEPSLQLPKVKILIGKCKT